MEDTLMNISLFLIIIGLGIAIPFTFVILTTIMVKVKDEAYQLDMSSLGKTYLVALLGWSIFVATITGG